MEDAQTQELSKRDRQKLNREKGKLVDTKAENNILSKLVVVILVVGLAFLAWKFITKTETTSQDTPVTADITEGSKVTNSDIVAGNPQAQVVFVEYGDYQCPACGAYYPVIKQLKEEYKDKVAFVHRDFPLRSIHKHAQIAAQAAFAAGQQGKFWEMHDKLYETQDSWSVVRDPRSDFEKFASELSLDIDKFKSDLNSDSARNFVNNSYNSAVAMGLNSTPSFILNGKLLDNPRGYEPLKALVEEELAKFANEATPSAEMQ